MRDLDNPYATILQFVEREVKISDSSVKEAVEGLEALYERSTAENPVLERRLKNVNDFLNHEFSQEELESDDFLVRGHILLTLNVWSEDAEG